MDACERQKAEAYYAVQSRAGYSGRCEMELPDNLAGKRVLDLMCRNGKGAYKLADRVGSAGFVLGVDPDAACIQRASANAAANHAMAGEWRRTLAFERGMPEDLRAAGIGDASFDVVFVNSALNLAWDLPQALREIARVLVPNGLLRHAGVFASVVQDQGRVRRLAAQGNVFGAARTCEEFERLAAEAGFARCSFSVGKPVAPDGFDAVPEAVEGTYATRVLSAFR